MERRQGLDEVIPRKQTDSFRQTTPEAVLSWKEQRQLTRKNHEGLFGVNRRIILDFRKSHECGEVEKILQNVIMQTANQYHDLKTACRQ
jgi:hypothetical protein